MLFVVFLERADDPPREKDRDQKQDRGGGSPDQQHLTEEQRLVLVVDRSVNHRDQRIAVALLDEIGQPAGLSAFLSLVQN